jgi:hypothetical protein
VDHRISSGGIETLDFSVRVRPGKSADPNFLGPFTQGPPNQRFVYIRWGTMADQPESCWTRRTKIPFKSITWGLIDEVRKSKSKVLQAEIEGKARDGGPNCAIVAIIGGGWKIVKA